MRQDYEQERLLVGAAIAIIGFVCMVIYVTVRRGPIRDASSPQERAAAYIQLIDAMVMDESPDTRAEGLRVARHRAALIAIRDSMHPSP